MPRGLPPGLTISPSTGVISGTPSRSGTYTFVVQAQDASGARVRAEKSILVNPFGLTGDLEDDYVGNAVSVTYTPSIPGTFTFAVSAGALPGGLTLNPSTGVLSGTLSTAGSFSWTITATNEDNETADRSDSCTILNPMWIAVSESTTILRSSNGIDWTAQGGTAGTWTGVAYGNGVFVKVSDSGLIESSADGVTWTNRTNPATGDNDLDGGVAFGNGRFVAAGAGGAGGNANLLTSTDGITWTAVKFSFGGANRKVWSVAFGDGKFVLTGDAGTYAITTNGSTISATGQISDTGWIINHVSYAHDAFFMLNGSGEMFRTTTGAPPEVEVDDIASVTFKAVASNGSRWISASASSNMRVSNDGVTWSNLSLAGLEISGGTDFVAYANGLFVATLYPSNVAYSTDGITFVNGTTNSVSTAQVTGIAFGGVP